MAERPQKSGGRACEAPLACAYSGILPNVERLTEPRGLYGDRKRRAEERRKRDHASERGPAARRWGHPLGDSESRGSDGLLLQGRRSAAAAKKSGGKYRKSMQIFLPCHPKGNRQEKATKNNKEQHVFWRVVAGGKKSRIKYSLP